MSTRADTAQEHALSLAFMRSHPGAAARVLDGLPAAQAASVFARAPARLGAPVLAAMLPRPAARCVALMDDERALELLGPLGTQATVALLRGVPEARRRSLVAGLPTAASLASAMLLGHAPDTLGAWADPDVVALPADTPVDQALERWRAGDTPHALLFVIDAERRLSGVVTLAALCRQAQATSLASVMQPAVALLPSGDSLGAALAHPGWALASMLPVVDPGEHLVGVMTHDALRRAVKRATPPAPPPRVAGGTVPALLGLAYWQSVAGLVSAGVNLLPRVPEAMAAPGDHDDD